MKALNFKEYWLNVMNDLSRKYPLRMGRYLTQEERDDIRRLCPDTGPDWTRWKQVGLHAAEQSIRRKFQQWAKSNLWS